MKKTLIVLALLAACGNAAAQTPSVMGFADCARHWVAEHGDKYERFRPEQFREIANNIVAYQNADGGWPKNIDVMAMFNPDSIRTCIDARHLESTLDNTNVYPQVEYLADVFYLTDDSTYCRSAARGMEYILAEQKLNGGWRGWDADAGTFDNNIMTDVLGLWLDVVQNRPAYAWVGSELRARIQRSWDEGLALVLGCQWTQNGVKTVWPQQCDNETLQPAKARAYEFPALSTGESAGIVLLLMRIKHPSPEVVASVKSAAAWFERSAITGKRMMLVDVPEGQREDPKIAKDRILVDDAAAEPLWARYYDLETNHPFFAMRAGQKVYTLEEVPAESRVDYGTWGNKVLKMYPEWLRKIVGRIGKPDLD